MTPSVSPEADWELTEGAVFYAREANAEVGLAFILDAAGSNGCENCLSRSIG
jgi:hypothetical protein